MTQMTRCAGQKSDTAISFISSQSQITRLVCPQIVLASTNIWQSVYLHVCRVLCCGGRLKPEGTDMPAALKACHKQSQHHARVSVRDIQPCTTSYLQDARLSSNICCVAKDTILFLRGPAQLCDHLCVASQRRIVIPGHQAPDLAAPLQEVTHMVSAKHMLMNNCSDATIFLQRL